MVAMDSGADNGFFYTSQVMHFSSPFTVFLIYHKQSIDLLVEIAAHFDTSLDYLVLGKETEIDQQKIRSAITLLSEIVQKK